MTKYTRFNIIVKLYKENVMKKVRVPETGGIMGESIVADYNAFQKGMRDRGLIMTDLVIKAGITSGTKALEIGPGPGYLGLEWLKKTDNTVLTGLEISPDMKKLAEKNAGDYRLTDRVNYVLSDATKNFPFEDNTFDGVFTSGSLHEWAKPVSVFNEIERVLKKGGKIFIGDLKRNINPILLFLMKSMVKQRSMKNGLISSIRSAYLVNEISELLRNSLLGNYSVTENGFGLVITGSK